MFSSSKLSEDELCHSSTDDDQVEKDKVIYVGSWVIVRPAIRPSLNVCPGVTSQLAKCPGILL